MLDLKSALSVMIKSLQEVFIILDALDECPKNAGRDEVLELIAEVHAWSFSNLHLLITSRQEPDIEDALTPLLTAPKIAMQGPQVDSDIRLHIECQLERDSKLKKWSADVKAEIMECLVAGANGM